jgi:hypothetical protein
LINETIATIKPAVGDEILIIYHLRYLRYFWISDFSTFCSTDP